MEGIKMDVEDVFKCPASSAHVLQSYNKFRNHMMKCKEARGKIFHVCPYFWAHQFISKSARDQHLEKCPKREGRPILPTNEWYQVSVTGSFPQMNDQAEPQPVPSTEPKKAMAAKEVDTITKQEYDDFLTVPKNLEQHLHFLNFKNKGFNFSMILKKPGKRQINYQTHFLLEQDAAWEKFFPQKLEQEDYEYILAGEFIPNLTSEKDYQQFLKFKEELNKKKFVQTSATDQKSNGEIAVVVDRTIPGFEHLHENCIAILIMTNESLPDRKGVIEKVDMQKYEGMYFVREKTEIEIETERKVIDDSFQKKGEFESKRIQDEYMELIKEKERTAEIQKKKKELEDRYQSLKMRGQEEESSRKKRIAELLATIRDLKNKSEKMRISNEQLQAEQSKQTKQILQEYGQKREEMAAKLMADRDDQIRQIQINKERVQTQIDTIRQSIYEMFPEHTDNLLARKKKEKEDLIATIEGVQDRTKREKTFNEQNKIILGEYCSVCLSSQACICLLPCAHLVLCRFCDRTLTSIGYFCCPLCNKNVERRYLVTRKELSEDTY